MATEHILRAGNISRNKIILSFYLKPRIEFRKNLFCFMDPLLPSHREAYKGAPLSLKRERCTHAEWLALHRCAGPLALGADMVQAPGMEDCHRRLPFQPCAPM